jgi:hypothetical protein
VNGDRIRAVGLGCSRLRRDKKNLDYGLAGAVRLVVARFGLVRLGLVWQVWLGVSRSGYVRLDVFRLGMVLCMVWQVR